MDQPEVVFLIGATGSLFILFMVTGFLLFIFLYQKKIIQKQVKFNDIERLLNDAEIKATNKVLDGIATERRKIAQEVHDHLGGLIAISSILADSLSERTDTEPLRSMSQKLAVTTKAAMEATRKIAHEIDSISSAESLKNSIMMICNSINSSQKQKVIAELDLTGDIPQEVCIQIFRIIQELFNNALKHSSAKEVHLHLSAFEGDYVSLIFQDNGKGMSNIQNEGLGLKSIKSRLKKMNGVYQLESNPEKGTVWVIEIPLNFNELR